VAVAEVTRHRTTILILPSSTTYALLTEVPKSAQPWIATLVRTIFDQPNADQVSAQLTRVRGPIAPGG
jgi:hypothetical protein